MIPVILYLLGGAVVGSLAGRLLRAYPRYNRLFFVGVGAVAALIIALLAKTSEPAEVLFAAFQYNRAIAAAFFFAVCCGFGYQGLNMLAADAPAERRTVMLRVADFSGALATMLMIVALALWNISLRG
jgi:hypothetical protein